MNNIETVTSLKVEFNWEVNASVALTRLEGTEAEGNMVAVNAIVNRNFLVAKLAALSRAGYSMDSSPSKSLLSEICEMDEILAVFGEV